MRRYTGCLVLLTGFVLFCLLGFGWMMSVNSHRIGSGNTIVDPLTARKGFTTHLRHVTMDTENSAHTGDFPTPPPPDIFQLIRYPSPAGQLAAYLSPDPHDGKKHPAIVWAHGGFGGIDDWLWKPHDQQDPSAFREAGILVMCPSWRGENDNPGQYEMFYGEIEDACAAIDYLAKLPYVDADRIYLGGHSTGGTVTMLAAEATTKLRAAFAFGGAPNMQHVVSDGKGYGNTPYDYANHEESRLRSPIEFTRALHHPLWYFEGESSAYCRDAQLMQALAEQYHVPFYAHIVAGGTHFSILQPLNHMLALKILSDTGPTCSISITDAEVEEACRQNGR